MQQHIQEQLLPLKNTCCTAAWAVWLRRYFQATCLSRLKSLGINDVYCKSGKPDELLEIHGLTSANIEVAVKDVISRKSHV